MAFDLINVFNITDNDNVALNGAVNPIFASVGGTPFLFVPEADDNGLTVFKIVKGGKLKAVDVVVDDALDNALELTGAPLLLDVANLYANAQNHGFDALAFLDALPEDCVAYAHLAGGVRRGGLYHDTHAHPVPAGALALAHEAASRLALPGLLLERDARFPPEAELHAELEGLAQVLRAGRPQQEQRREEVRHGR